MSELNLNPAYLRLRVPLGDTLEKNFKVPYELTAGDISASVYFPEEQLFTVDIVSSNEDETVFTITLPDTSEPLDGKWKLVLTNQGTRTLVSGDIIIGDIDPDTVGNVASTIEVKESTNAIQLKFIGDPGPQGVQGPIGPEGPQGPEGRDAVHFFQDTAPSQADASLNNPEVVAKIGDFWTNSDTGSEYVLLTDGSTTQWVEFGNTALVEDLEQFNFVSSLDVDTIVKLTQAEYDALTPDGNTLYLIT